MYRTKIDRNMWHRLEGYSFHERPLVRSIVDKLAEETGHSTDVCYILVEEYRRFMYLMGISKEPLSASPIVSLVWRLHAEDENAYYNDFCRRIIGRRIPYQQGTNDVRNDSSYERALKLYAQEFGPADVQFWPDPVFAMYTVAFGCALGLASFILAFIFWSIPLVIFGVLGVVGGFFFKWKFSSLPLHNDDREERVVERPV